MTFHLPILPEWLKTGAVGVGLVLSHAYVYLRDHRADVYRLLSKGARMTLAITPLNAQDAQAVVVAVQHLVKMGLPFVPGTTDDEKAANITAEVRPAFDAMLTPLNLPGFVNDYADKVLGWMVAQEVKAASAS